MFDKHLWDNKFFPNPLDANEDIILVLREDVVILVFQALGYVFVFFICSLLRALLSDVFTGSAAYVMDIIYASVNILLLTGFVLRFHDYYLSVQIVTSRRIIDITQRGLFTRETNELGYNSIEDVTNKQAGLLATMFNYGDIIIQTAASVSSKTSGFVFKNIPNPSKVHTIIMDIYHDTTPTQSKPERSV